MAPMKICPVDDTPFGARVTNFDCSCCDKDTADELRDALHHHQVLVFSGQHHLTPEQEVAFYRMIDIHGRSIWRDQANNPWEVFKVKQGNRAGTYQLPNTPAVLALGKGEIDHFGLRVSLGGDRGAYGNDKGSQVLGGGALQWHIDGTFYDFAPCHYTQMRCIEAPAGPGHWLSYEDNSGARLWCAAGATAFASGRAAYDQLPDDTREKLFKTHVHYASRPFENSYHLGNSANGLRLVDVEMEQNYKLGMDVPGSGVKDPLAQVYPLLWTCPVTGQHALMAQPRCMHALEQPNGQDSPFLGVVESRFQLESWMRPAINPELVYVHAWEPGDLVIWHNRSVWHSATGQLSSDDRRIMHLVALNGDKSPRCAPN